MTCELDENILVAEAKTDPLAFGMLYDRHYRAIYGFLVKRTGNVDVAKDLTSETFFQALRRISSYEQRGRPFVSWLFAIAVAQVGNYYRSRRKLFRLVHEESPELMADELYEPDRAYLASEDDAETKANILLARKLMRKLSDTQQTILTLRYLTPHSVAEIGQILGMKEGTIKSHIHRALKKLQRLMHDAKETSYVTKPQHTLHGRPVLAPKGSASHR